MSIDEHEHLIGLDDYDMNYSDTGDGDNTYYPPKSGMKKFNKPVRIVRY